MVAAASTENPKPQLQESGNDAHRSQAVSRGQRREYVLAQFVDIHGAAKTKAVPAAHFESILTTGAGFAGFAVWGLGIEPNGPDYMAIGDLSTLTLVPWQPATPASPATAT